MSKNLTEIIIINNQKIIPSMAIFSSFLLKSSKTISWYQSERILVSAKKVQNIKLLFFFSIANWDQLELFVRPIVYKIVSSAWKWYLQCLTEEHILLMYRESSRGPGTTPCGAPLWILKLSDRTDKAREPGNWETTVSSRQTAQCMWSRWVSLTISTALLRSKK